MNVAIVGGNGQLGCDLAEAFTANGDHATALAHSDIEITHPVSVEKALVPLHPEVIVNTAAMHHVESCELDPERAFSVNALGPKNLALVARQLNAVLIHFSTDYVFDGTKSTPYLEDDTPRPLNVYGVTKLAGEYFVRCSTEKHFVVRTSALYGKNPCRAKGGLNFVELMLKLAKERPEIRVVANEVVSPTWTAELARQIVHLVRSDAYGLYHATAEGSCSWYDFAREIFSLTSSQVSLTVAGPNEFPAKVPRPAYSVLENRSLKRLGAHLFSPWQEALRNYLGISSTRHHAMTQ